MLIPLAIWSWKKNASYRIEKDGKKVLNFQITMTLALFAMVVFLMLLIPVGMLWTSEGLPESGLMFGMSVFTATLPMIGLGFFATYQGFVNAFRAVNGGESKYPLSIQFLK